MAEAGIALAPEPKSADTTGEVEGLGVCVDAVGGTASYPVSKAERLRQFILQVIADCDEEGEGGGKVSKDSLESLVGKEKWLAHLAPQVARHLASAHSVVRSPCPVDRVKPPKDLAADQRLVLQVLDSDPHVPLVPKAVFPPWCEHRVMFTDACNTGWGGFSYEPPYFYYAWHTWPAHVEAALRARPRLLSISAGELFAEKEFFHMITQAALPQPYCTGMQDNNAARGAATRGSSSAPQMAPLAEALDAEATAQSTALRTVRVGTKENAVADALSRGDDGLARQRARELRARAVRLQFVESRYEALDQVIGISR